MSIQLDTERLTRVSTVDPLPTSSIKIPGWLEDDFFKRLSFAAKQRIAEKTAHIDEISNDQLRSLKERRFDTDPFYKNDDWIYLAFKAYAEKRLNHFEIADLTLYDSLRRNPEASFYFGRNAATKLEEGFAFNPDKSRFQISWKNLKAFIETLPENERWVYSYPCHYNRTRSHKCESNHGDKELQASLLCKYLPVILYQEESICHPIIMPPSLLHKFLKYNVGDEQAVTPNPVLGYFAGDDLSNPDVRVMSILHPELTEEAKDYTVHACYGFDSKFQTIYFHDIYHLTLSSLIPYRKAIIKLIEASELAMKQVIKSIVVDSEFATQALKEISDEILDMEFTTYQQPSFEFGLTPVLDKMERTVKYAFPNVDKDLQQTILKTFNKEVRDYIQQKIKEKDPDFEKFSSKPFDRNKDRILPSF